MPKLRSRGARLRRMMLSVPWVLPLGGLAPPALAQQVPAQLRTCAADPDPGRRLDCYDTEMKRLLAPSARPARTGGTTSPAPPQEQQPAAGSAPAHADLGASPAPAATAAMTPTTATAQTAGDSARAPGAPPQPPAWKKIFGMGAGASHLSARIVRLDRSPDAMVLHLDNGQTWRQVGRASGDLSLRAGDKVTIEEHLGSYWLSSRHVSDMKVRQDAE